MPRASTSWVCTGISSTSSGSRSSWSSTSSVAEEARVSVESHLPLQESSPEVVDVPASTPWPLVLAFGVMLLFGGLATSAALSALGAVAAIAGVVGWFRQVLPREAQEKVMADPAPAPPLTTRREVVHLQVVGGSRRAWLPVEIYPVSAGIRGGLAGGLAMAILALLYGAMLPMLPRRPILLGGLVVPLVWSALFYGIIGVVNPVFKQHVAWLWFVVCQIGFGVVAGLVVSRRERVKTWQGAPLVLRAGIEAIGLEREPGGGTQR